MENEFKEKMKQTKESEKELLGASDGEKIEEILTGQKIIKLAAFPTLAFIFPGVGTVLEGDRIVAEYKAQQLRRGKLLTKAQLKAIYGRPTEVEVEGVKVIVGSGVWTAVEENDIELLPMQIKEKNLVFEDLRERYQKIEIEILGLSNSKKDKNRKDKIEAEKIKLSKDADIVFSEVIELRRKLLLLQIKHLELFVTSLEERAEFEKISYYIPKCVFKVLPDGSMVPFWSSNEDMGSAAFAATQIISLFNLFIRGYDVDAFFTGGLLEK
uniref:Uncharacterized protein n=1 Tax=viral metagenome TaxID=1070528 RepID=A0A6M3IIU6_9ZZZZ